jgi:hypothetical protein
VTLFAAVIGDGLPRTYYSELTEYLLEATTNYATSVMFAAPFAAGAMLEHSWMSTNLDAISKRR